MLPSFFNSSQALSSYTKEKTKDLSGLSGFFFSSAFQTVRKIPTIFHGSEREGLGQEKRAKTSIRITNANLRVIYWVCTISMHRQMNKTKMNSASFFISTPEQITSKQLLHICQVETQSDSGASTCFHTNRNIIYFAKDSTSIQHGPVQQVPFIQNEQFGSKQKQAIYRTFISPLMILN